MFEDIVALEPAHFFSTQIPCNYLQTKSISSKRYKLPDTRYLFNEKSFAEKYLAWDEENIYFFLECSFPFPSENENVFVELFFDTKNQKNRRFTSIFSHHFVFYTKKIEGSYGKEVTRFSQNSHSLADPHSLQVQFQKKMRSFTMEITIAEYCLHGSELSFENNLGFTYVIHHPEGEKNHFSTSSNEVNILQNSYLWTSLSLTK